jgi:hypothetical protein
MRLKESGNLTKRFSKMLKKFTAQMLKNHMLASALKRGVHPPGTLNFNIYSGGDGLSLGHLLRTWRTEEIPYAKLT